MDERIVTGCQLREFSDHLVREEKSRATREKYLRDVRAFSAYLSGAEVTKETVIAYKNKSAEKSKKKKKKY